MRYFCTMNRKQTMEEYRVRIAAAKRYVREHLDEELVLDDVAAAAAFSPYHFHRIFRAHTAEPLGAYITRLRVEMAAQLLCETAQPIEQIAYAVGFATPASLSRAFRTLYGQSPSVYRTQPNQHIKTMKTTPKTAVKLAAPKFVELEPRQALYISATGDYAAVDFDGSFARLWAEVKAQNLFTAGIEHLAIFHDDPKLTEIDKRRTDICLTIHKPAVERDGIRVMDIPGGRYAVFTHIGPYDEVGPTYDAIYGEWVPANCQCEDCDCGDDCKCILRDAPAYEKYCNDPCKTEPAKLKTEIYIPIQ